MNKILNKTTQFILSKQSSIFSSAMLLSVMIIIARLFGFLRYRILAGFYSTAELDIFFASFRIPDLVFEILITGALTSSFIPIFIKYQDNKEVLRQNVSSIINAIFLLMLVIIVVLLFVLDPVMRIITPGFSQDKIQQVVYYSRLLLIGQLPFLILANFLTGISQAKKTFLLSAVAPIIYNLSIIVFTVLFSSQLSLLAPVIGVMVGAVLMFIVQVPILFHCDFVYDLYLKKTKGLIDFIRMVIPRMFTIVVAQIDATIDLILATLLGTGSYTYFYLAQHLQLLPVSVIGIAFGQASLPYLSEMYQQKKMEEFKKIISESLLNLLFLSIPFASFFIFARTPLIRLFFGGPKFDWLATNQTALTLSCFSLSLPFHTVYYFLTRCYYASLDSRSPFLISLISILTNTVFSLIFVFVLKLPVWSLAISFSLAMIVNVFLLIFFLIKKVNHLFDVNFFVELGKIIIATFISSIIAYFVLKISDTLIFDNTRTINIFFMLLINGLLFCCSYFFISWTLNIKEIYLISKLLIKAREYQRRFVEIYTDYE